MKLDGDWFSRIAINVKDEFLSPRALGQVDVFRLGRPLLGAKRFVEVMGHREEADDRRLPGTRQIPVAPIVGMRTIDHVHSLFHGHGIARRHKCHVGKIIHRHGCDRDQSRYRHDVSSSSRSARPSPNGKDRVTDHWLLVHTRGQRSQLFEQRQQSLPNREKEIGDRESTRDPAHDAGSDGTENDGDHRRPENDPVKFLAAPTPRREPDPRPGLLDAEASFPMPVRFVRFLFDINIRPAVRAVLDRPLLSRRECRSLAALLAHHIHGQPGLRVPAFGVSSFVFGQDLSCSLAVGPLDPDLRLVNLGNGPSNPQPGLRVVLDRDGLDPGIVQQAAHEVSLDIAARVIRRDGITKGHVCVASLVEQTFERWLRAPEDVLSPSFPKQAHSP